MKLYRKRVIQKETYRYRGANRYRLQRYRNTEKCREIQIQKKKKAFAENEKVTPEVKSCPYPQSFRQSKQLRQTGSDVDTPIRRFL